MIKGTIRLNDDSIEFISDHHDLANLIKDRLGFGAGKLVAELGELADDNAMRLKSDLLSFEGSLESMTSAMQDIKDIVISIKIQLEKDRLSRSELRKLIDSISLKLDYFV